MKFLFLQQAELRAQLFFGRDQFFVHRGQFFIAGSQLFIGGNQLFVQRLLFLVAFMQNLLDGHDLANVTDNTDAGGDAGELDFFRTDLYRKYIAVFAPVLGTEQCTARQCGFQLIGD